MLKEIGSEFWTSGPVMRNKVYLISGRTALDYIIRDIKKSYNIRSVLLPSYCCDTMIEPFYRHNIMVRFYDIYFDETNGLSAELPQAQENEILYYMTFFGFHHLKGVNVNEIKNDFTVVIEDTTHSWLSGDKNCYADYSYSSFRKWTGFDGIALASKTNGFFWKFPEVTGADYLALRKQAFSKKRAFMDLNIGDKQEFLELFNKAEELLERDYVGYRASTETLSAFFQLDILYIAKRRQRNARFLIEGLQDCTGLKLMFQTMEDNEVPLFVPVLVMDKRDELRKYLIDHAIYCPIHWPKSMYHGQISERAEMIYRQELSLVCDQRYDSEDMKRIVGCIKEYYKK